jgi:predicted regulator of amino acid metabolism with ACT domain
VGLKFFISERITCVASGRSERISILFPHRVPRTTLIFLIAKVPDSSVISVDISHCPGARIVTAVIGRVGKGDTIGISIVAKSPKTETGSLIAIVTEKLSH